MKELLKRFHLNGHIIGFHPQAQKLELPNKTPSSALAVKGSREGGGGGVSRERGANLI